MTGFFGCVLSWGLGKVDDRAMLYMMNTNRPFWQTGTGLEEIQSRRIMLPR